MKRTLLLLLFLAISSPFSLRADKLKVFLLCGQSNADGRAPVEDLPEALREPVPEVLFYHKFVDAPQALSPGKGSFGPEVGFGHALHRLYPEEKFAILKYAVGGTSLFGAWHAEEGPEYRRFQRTVKQGIEKLTEAGHTVEIVGVLWVQGEADAKRDQTTEQYQTNLAALFSDMRSLYGEKLPIFYSRLADTQRSIPAEKLATIRKAQEHVAEVDPLAYMIDADGMKMKSDNLHYNAEGQVSLGEAFAKAYHATASKPEPAP